MPSARRYHPPALPERGLAIKLRLNRFVPERPIWRRSCLALAVFAFGLAVTSPAAASAAFYASPSGSGTACNQATPCSLQSAINTAASGDDVYVIADQGDYRISSELNTSAGVPIHVHGLNGRARLIFSSGAFNLRGGTADGLYVESDSSSTAFRLYNATADRVFVKSGATGRAC